MGAIRRIVLCADDYALAPGVSSAIRTLISRCRLNATSVMTLTPGFAEEASALAATSTPLHLSIGLHVTLTGPFEPLRASPLPSKDGRFPALAEYLKPTAWRRISQNAVEAETGAQIEAFRGAFGRPPDFIDGHQHVQLLPGVRAGFLAAVARAAPAAWVRQCGPVRLRRLLSADAKTRALAWLSRGFRRRARAKGLATNPAFAGAYDFSTAEDFGTLFARFLAELPDGGVVMCHPGFVDKELRARDPLTERREAEYVFLAGDGLPRALERAGATLA
ncbi:MAG: ChbG/HpnK family deacetylase [Xanthobacteraceae bacterium]|nr:ChbG/HpnK family deacetylase [Xanthobacteraceae bacterium]